VKRGRSWSSRSPGLSLAEAVEGEAAPAVGGQNVALAKAATAGRSGQDWAGCW
jgi:hypothetical protein